MATMKAPDHLLAMLDGYCHITALVGVPPLREKNL
jgi:hypothetical protein